MQTQHLEFFRGKHINEALVFIHSLEEESIQDIIDEAEFLSLAYPRGTKDIEIERVLTILCEAFDTHEMLSYRSASIRCGLALRRYSNTDRNLQVAIVNSGDEKQLDAPSAFLFNSK